jgi:hypothetical protein
LLNQIGHGIALVQQAQLAVRRLHGTKCNLYTYMHIHPGKTCISIHRTLTNGKPQTEKRRPIAPSCLPGT